MKVFQTTMKQLIRSQFNSSSKVDNHVFHYVGITICSQVNYIHMKFRANFYFLVHTIHIALKWNLTLLQWKISIFSYHRYIITYHTIYFHLIFHSLKFSKIIFYHVVHIYIGQLTKVELQWGNVSFVGFYYYKQHSILYFKLTKLSIGIFNFKGHLR